MPIPAQISTAASIFRQNNTALAKTFDGLEADDWLGSPKESSNPILWIAGHIVWARAMALKTLGHTWERPWMTQFARGAKLPTASEYPAPDEVLSGWADVSSELASALESASDEALSAPTGERSPSFDGKVGGMVSFLAYHEAYHVGQAAYLRCWLGHGGIAG